MCCSLASKDRFALIFQLTNLFFMIFNKRLHSLFPPCVQVHHLQRPGCARGRLAFRADRAVDFRKLRLLWPPESGHYIEARRNRPLLRPWEAVWHLRLARSLFVVFVQRSAQVCPPCSSEDVLFSMLPQEAKMFIKNNNYNFILNYFLFNLKYFHMDLFYIYIENYIKKW